MMPWFFMDKPVRKFARLLETYLAVAPGGLEAALGQLVGAALATPRTAVTLTKAMLAASGEDRLRRMDEVAAAFRLSEGEL